MKIASKIVKIGELKVADLRRELDERKLETAGMKVILKQRLTETLEKKVEDISNYLFNVPGDGPSILNKVLENFTALEKKLLENSTILGERLLNNLLEKSSALEEKLTDNNKYVGERLGDLETEIKTFRLALSEIALKNGEQCIEIQQINMNLKNIL